MRTGPVLLFDGECGLCIRCVETLLKADRRRRLRFAPLQGVQGQALLRARGLSTVDFASVVWVLEWELRGEVPLLFRTDALLATARLLGGAFRLLTVLRVLPVSVRDAGYQLVARARRRLFGAGTVESLRENPAWRDRVME